ncbi:MAG: hypothetical protein ACE5R6_18120 [Candidatus Heimdallarchaeota archaeon]
MNIALVESGFDKIIEDESINIEQVADLDFNLRMYQSYGELKSTLTEILTVLMQLLKALAVWDFSLANSEVD